MSDPSPTLPSPTKRALLVGIDAYQTSPKIPTLEGCVNDAQLVQSILLEQFGFSPGNVTLLTNDQATRDGILAAFDALVAATGTDDIVVFYYAGHGSQMTDREGDEASGLDNTIMPTDSEGWSGVNRDITDDEIHLRLKALGAKTSFTTLIVDACHSGTITRDAFGEASRGVPADRRPISELPPSPIPKEATRSVGGAAGERGPSGWMPLADQYVLIAGCRDEELAKEHRPPEGEGKIVHGALTYFLGQELRRATSGTSYRDVFERAAARVTGTYPTQHPQMEGRVDRAVFGVTDLTPMQFARVESRTGDRVTLTAGAAHGMTVESVWTVYPQGTKHGGEAAALGTIEITSVRAVRADARITSEASPGAIGADTRAVETTHAYGTLRLRVQLDASVAAAEARGVAPARSLREAVAESRLLEMVNIDSAAAVRVYLIEPRTAVKDGDPAPQLGPVGAPVWAVIGTDGQLQMPPKALDEFLDVCANLEKLARYRQALDLENPNSSSALRGKFELNLLRHAPDGSWVVAEPETAGGLPVYRDGDEIAFEIKSRHDAKAYVSLLDFSPTGAISLIFPAPNATDQVTPTVRFQIGTRPGDDAFSVSYPSAFPFGDGGPVDALETVKLFVTTTDAGFSFLEQSGMRAVRSRSGPLQMLWETATGAAEVRDIVRKTMPVDTEDWTTLVRPFVIRRKATVTAPVSVKAVAATAALPA